MKKILINLIATFAILFSLYQTVFLQKIPCSLCQIERYLLFPIPFILPFLNNPKWILPLSLSGVIVTIIQIGKGFISCSQCLITIALPLGSLTVFIAISLLLLIEIKPLGIKWYFR